MEKITLFSADIDTKDIVKTLADYKRQLEELKLAQKGLDTSTKEGSESFVKNQAEIKKIRGESKQYENTLVQLNKASGNFLTVQESLNKSLSKEVKTINDARASNKELLAVRNNLNLKSKEGVAAQKKVNEQLEKNNAFIKENVSGLEKQKINIGNYGGAVGKLTGLLKRLGGAFAVFKLIKGAFSVVKEFEQSQANLASVLGTSVDKMAALTEQAKFLGSTTTFTASQVAELALQFAKLGFSQEEIEGVTEATLALAEATGSDLGEAATVVGATIRGFGLDVSETQRVTDVMAKSFTSSSLDMAKFSTAMASVAPVANLAGVSIEKTTALIGTLTDRGLDASTAGTGLRNMFLRSNKAGLSFGEALNKIKDSTDQTGTAMDLFGVRGATLGVILANTQEDVQGLTEKMIDSEGAAKQMAETQRDTLGGSIKLLQSAWEGLILKFEQGTGVFGTVKDVILVLADNLGLIAKALITVVGVWGAYKAAVLLASLQSSLMAKQASITRMAMLGQAKGVSLATFSFKAFNKALKANALLLVIGGLIALVAAFRNVNKSISENVKELHKSNEEFITQAKASVELNDKLSTMADRYDTLKTKAGKSKEEQIELDKIIKDIARNVPSAVTEVDKYGNALEINTGKVKEFNQENGKISSLQAEVNIDKQKKVLSELGDELERVDKINKEGNVTYIEGVGAVQKVDGVLQKVTTSTGKYSSGVGSSIKLNKEQQLVYAQYIKGLEDGVKTTTKDIELNEDIISSVTGVKNARQIAADEKAKSDTEALKQIEEDAKKLKQIEEDAKKAAGTPEQNAKKALDIIKRNSEAEISASKLRLKLLQEENEANPSLEKLAQEQILRDERIKILDSELTAYEASEEFKNALDSERKLKYLEFTSERIGINQTFADASVEVAVETGLRELEIFREKNKSVLEDGKFLSSELKALESERLDNLFDAELSQLELSLSNKLISEAEFQAQKAELIVGLKDEQKELDLQAEAAETERLLENFNNELEIRKLNGESLFTLRLEELERLRLAEIENAEGTAADIALINDKYSKQTDAVNKAEQKGKVDNAMNTAAAISGLLKEIAGENKALAITAALIDGGLAVQKTLASVPFPLSLIPAAAVAIRTGKNIQNIRKAEKGISFEGTLKGKSHAQGGINLGNGIEAEGGENMYSDGNSTHIVNKKASSLINRLGIMGALSFINQREGRGVALNVPTSFAAKGGLISTGGANNVEIDYTRLTEAFVAGGSQIRPSVSVDAINNVNQNLTEVSEFATV